jgi:P27 family predicted phage terminase small subunit
MPTVLKAVRGNPGKRRLSQGEPRPSQLSAPPEPPPGLGADAQAVWRELAPELFHMKLLTGADLNGFAVYCAAVGRWRRTEAEMADGQLLTQGSTGQLVPNPLVAIARDAARDVVMFGREFGLSPAARVRLAANGYKEPETFGKFHGLIA